MLDVERQVRETNDRRNEDKLREVDGMLVTALQGELEHQNENIGRIEGLLSEKFGQVGEEMQAQWQDEQHVKQMKVSRLGSELEALRE